MQRELVIDGRRIETSWHGPSPEQVPTLVLLHEGLGCVAMWRGFPERLSQETGCGVFAYSRFGYGSSDPAPLPWSVNYMHDEALKVLPRVLDAAGIRKCVLIGHSDGSSIATIYAGGTQDPRVRGLVLMAPHFFVEDISIRSIEAAKAAYEQSDLRARLAKYHNHVDVAFRGWNGAWLNPAFRHWLIEDSVAHVRVPMLMIQGEEDEYGTPEQLALAEREAYCPVETLLLPDCRHSPHLDQPDATLKAIGEFVRHIFVVHEGLLPAA